MQKVEDGVCDFGSSRLRKRGMPAWVSLSFGSIELPLGSDSRSSLRTRKVLASIIYSLASCGGRRLEQEHYVSLGPRAE